jgi:hypothetical protein
MILSLENSIEVMASVIHSRPGAALDNILREVNEKRRTQFDPKVIGVLKVIDGMKEPSLVNTAEKVAREVEVSIRNSIGFKTAG